MTLSRSEIRARCTRSLLGHKPRSTRQWLASMAASPLADSPPDLYGEGETISSLEKEVASLLGKEAGVFVMKGMIAQFAALRAWTDRSGVRNVGLHPRCHIEVDEGDAYERLQPLRGIHLGSYEPFRVADLEAVTERLGVVTVELPLRRSGFRLPSWDELAAISDWCKQQHVPLHFDGARLWQCASYYGCDFAEIAALADSVYVSFYKDLGGLAGCVLAGPADFIREVKTWKMRHGGNIYTSFPYVITAAEGLREYLPRMESYYLRAQELATALSAIPGVRVAPDPPHTNAFQIYLQGGREELEQAALELAEEEKVWLFGGFADTPVPSMVMSEIQIGNAVEELTTDEVVGLIGRLVERSRK